MTITTSDLTELKRRYASMYIQEDIELDEELKTIYSSLGEVYDNLDIDEQYEFDAILELHEEGEISDEELVEGLADYLTKGGRAGAKRRKMEKKTGKMADKVAKKAAGKKQYDDDKAAIGAEKAKQKKIKDDNPSALKKGLKKVGAGLKKVFGKTDSKSSGDSKPAGEPKKKKKNGAPAESVEYSNPATVGTLRKIVSEKQDLSVMFESGQSIVDSFTASAMVQVYDDLNPAMKNKFEEMILDKAGFLETQEFAMKMLSWKNI